MLNKIINLLKKTVGPNHSVAPVIHVAYNYCFIFAF